MTILTQFLRTTTLAESFDTINALLADVAALKANGAPTPTPTLSLSTAITVQEGNAGTTAVTTTITVNRNGVSGALVVNPAYAGTAGIGSDYQAGPATVTVPAGQNTVDFILNIIGDTTQESNETIIITATLAAYPFVTAGRVITIGNDDSASLAAPTGFYLNGSTNPTWSTAVAAILGGSTTRYRAMLVSDSTGVGQGGGTDGSAWLGAWQNRPTRWMAQRLTSAGVAANHLAFTADQGAATNGNTAQDSTDYNTPVITFGAWLRNGYSNLPGGSYLTAPDTTQLLTYNIPAGTNKFLLIGINAGGTAGSVEIRVDGADPVEGASALTTVGTNSGYSQTLVSVNGKGAHTLTLRKTTGGIAVNGLLAYDGSAGGVDFYTNARPGATTAERATTGGNFEARSFLAYVAPAVTVINLGLNDLAQGIPAATITANLQLIITTAKVSGDVLLMFPQPAAAPFNNNVTAVHAAVKQLAVDNGIAFFSLFEFEGGVFTASDMQDANVHPKAATYQRYHTATGVALLKMAGL